MTKETVAALVGALVGLLGGWIVAAVTERLRERRKLYAAMTLVATELRENAERVKGRHDPKFGDWERNKIQFAELIWRGETLWTEVTTAYGNLYELKSRPEKHDEMKHGHLRELADKLDSVRPAQFRTFTDRFWYVGPIIWLLSIEYFGAQIVVDRAWRTSYSIVRNPISDLGNTACGLYSHRYVCSPLHDWMNASFITLGAVMMAGSALIYQEFRDSPGVAAEERKELRTGRRVGFTGMAIAGFGTVFVGVFPENVNHTLHVLGAAGPFFIGNIALLFLGWALSVPDPLRWITALAGGVGLVGLVVLVVFGAPSGGEGLVERVVAYPQTFWLVGFGIYMCTPHYRKLRNRRKDEAAARTQRAGAAALAAPSASPPAATA